MKPPKVPTFSEHAHIYIYVYIHIFLHTHISIHTYVYVYVHVRIFQAVPGYKDGHAEGPRPRTQTLDTSPLSSSWIVVLIRAL